MSAQQSTSCCPCPCCRPMRWRDAGLMLLAALFAATVCLGALMLFSRPDVSPSPRSQEEPWCAPCDPCQDHYQWCEPPLRLSEPVEERR